LKYGSSAVPATEVTASISAPRCCTESSAFGRFVLVAKLIHLLGATAGPCADTTVHTLVFQLFRYPTNSWISFYVPVLRSWLVASTLINFQQISECKLTQLYSLPDTGKKADKKRYLFTRPRRKWTCSNGNMLYILCFRWILNPQGSRVSVKMPAKTSVVQPLCKFRIFG